MRRLRLRKIKWLAQRNSATIGHRRKVEPRQSDSTAWALKPWAAPPVRPQRSPRAVTRHAWALQRFPTVRQGRLHEWGKRGPGKLRLEQGHTESFCSGRGRTPESVGPPWAPEPQSPPAPRLRWPGRRGQACEQVHRPQGAGCGAKTKVRPPHLPSVSPRALPGRQNFTGPTGAAMLGWKVTRETPPLRWARRGRGAWPARRLCPGGSGGVTAELRPRPRGRHRAPPPSHVIYGPAPGALRRRPLTHVTSPAILGERVPFSEVLSVVCEGSRWPS